MIAGVAGELWIEVRASRVETDLREETGKIISGTNERAARAEQATAELNNGNLKLRRAILPRVIVFGNRDGDTQARQARLAEVREYSGTKVLIESVSRNEPETLSLNIVELLRQSNWPPQQNLWGDSGSGSRPKL